MAEILFWFFLMYIIYTYLGYPLILKLRNLFFKAPVKKAFPGEVPLVSVLMAVRNEENNILDKITNLKQQDYAADKIEIIVVSDGSDDKTLEILQQLRDEHDGSVNCPKIKIISIEENKGKPNALNVGIRAAEGEFIVFTDARQRFNKVAVKELISNFSDPEVGSVSGELVFVQYKKSPVQAEMGLYWKFEKSIRRMESERHSVPGATGAIYAVRKELYTAIPKETLLDDVFLPMRIILSGYRNVFDGKAKAYDVFSKNFEHEKKRKIRTLVGNYQLIKLVPQILDPRQNQIFFEFLSHKVFRLLVPFMFIGATIAAIFSSGYFYGFFLFGVVFAVVLALTKRYTEKLPLLGAIGKVASTFFGLNYFAFLAFFYWIVRGNEQEW